MRGSFIAGTGSALPEHELTSAELEDSLELPRGWIESRTGIVSRRIAGAADSACTLGVAASRAALSAADVDPSEVDYVIAATVTPDFRFPALASLLQSALGCEAAAYDVNAGCSGFLCALAQADALVRAGSARTVLVAGVEILSRIVDFSDRKTGILFGDGAGAAVVRAAEAPHLGPFLLRSDGARPDLLMASRDGGKVVMAGREVYKRAVTEMTASVRQLGVPIEDVDLVLAHQANGRILEAVAERLGLPREKLFTNIARHGNTSAASIPIGLAEAQAQGRLRDGDLVVLAAFGAGLVWGAGLVRWAAPAAGERHGARTEVARV